MENSNSNEPRRCETCDVEMQKMQDTANCLDVNRISLLAMFRISKFYVFQCPACNKVSLHI